MANPYFPTYRPETHSLSDKETGVIDYCLEKYPKKFRNKSKVLQHIIMDWAKRTGNQPPTAEAEYHGEGAA